MPPATTEFGIINYIVVAVYLAAMLAIGLGFSSRNTSTDAYFRGGQRVPTIIAGLSIFATLLSSLTFMALPAVAFATDWSYYFSSLSAYLIAAPIVIYFYLPFFRRLDVTTAYEYLENRFNYPARLFGSASFILFHFFRIAIILFLPALALSTVANIPIHLSVPLVGILCLLYTIFGGITAVVWTDAIQTVVLLGAAVAAIGVALWGIDGGLGTFFEVALAERKFFGQVPVVDGFNMGLLLIALGGFFFNLSGYTSQQDVVQRYVTTKDVGAAARSIWINALVGTLGVTVFFMLGTAIYVFYHSHPERLAEGLANDAIFPFFIVNELPAGIAGLVVAGIFAASQSSVSSSLNSISTAWIVDVHRRLYPGITDSDQLKLAKWIVTIVGLICIGMAYGLSYVDARSLFDVMMMVGGLIGSALGGMFALGIFTRRPSGVHALLGAGCAIALLLYLWLSADVTFWLYAPTGFLTTFAVGWLSSFLIGSSSHNRLPEQS